MAPRRSPCAVKVYSMLQNTQALCRKDETTCGNFVFM